MFGAPNESTILRLRVEGSDLDPLALRGRVTSILNEVSMQPRLPPSATLFIRKLSDPLPGSLQLDTTLPRVPLAWRHAFNTKFDQLVSSAARPAFGPVAESVESVVFYDYAELLACLSADWCSGSVMTRWWWQSLMKRGDVARLIKQLWREKIEYAPAAMQLLVKKDAVVEFVRRLSEVETLELVRCLVKAFGLHALETRISRIKETDLVVEAEAVRETRVSYKAPPWIQVVPESFTLQLQPAQQLFVGIALMIQRAPARARTINFAREVEQWIGRALVEQSIVQDPAIQVVDDVDVVQKVTSYEFSEPSRNHASIRVNQIDAPIVHSAPAVSTPPGSALSVVPFEEPEKISAEPTIVTDHRPVIHIEETVEAPETIITPVTETLEAITIETELAGLFYLINLAIFMEIYSDFTSPSEQFHDDLSIWDFVMIVGREINGDRDLEDPIWTGLQDLQDVQDRTHENPVHTPAWLHDRLPHIKARLRQALGITYEEDLADLLLHHHAKVIITPTHIDIFFALATHPIEIRFSGLDRDPGWVPAAGRFIAFHYD